MSSQQYKKLSSAHEMIFTPHFTMTHDLREREYLSLMQLLDDLPIPGRTPNRAVKRKTVIVALYRPHGRKFRD